MRASVSRKNYRMRIRYPHRKTARQGNVLMARNTKVDADPNAPPITQILAKFVATHPSRGWSDAVDHEAHRTFLNWAGCAVGAARHESAQAALAGLAMLEPSRQASVL